MNLLTIIGISVGLAMDAFAVSVASSVILGGVTARQTFRISFHFGLFQFMMPILGWLAGRSVVQLVEAWDHWVAFAILAFIGSKAVLSAVRGDADRASRADPSRGLNLVFLSIATSMDALAVGVSFAMLRVEIWYPSVIIGLITGALCVLGMLFGYRIGSRMGKRIEIVGGLVLIAIGLKILLEL